MSQSTGTIDTFSISNQTYSTTPFTFTAPTITGDGSITYGITGETDLGDLVLAPGSVATINSTTGEITMVRTGKVTVTATLSETINYTGTTSTVTFTISKATGTLGTLTIPDQTYSTTPFTFTTPTITGDGSITYSITGETDLGDLVLAPGSVATINSTTGSITMVRSGKVTVTATLSETINYTGTTSTVTFTISKATGTLDTFSISNQTYSTTPFTFTAPVITGDGSITYGITGETDLADLVLAPGSVATINSTTGEITMVRTGKVTVTATLSETNNYTGTTSTVTFTISKATGTIDTFNIANQTYNVSPFTFTAATRTGDGSITYGITGETDLGDIVLTLGSVATIGGTRQITMGRSGKVTVTATLSETINYTGTTRSTTFTINKASGALGTLTIANQTFNLSPFTFTAPAITGDGTITYGITGETDLSDIVLTPSSVATINSTTGAITMVRSGKVTVTATLIETNKYTGTTSVVTFTISKATGSLGTFSIANQTFNLSPFTFTAPAITGDGTITYAITGETDLANIPLILGSVATINSTTGEITMVRSGKVTVTATLSETNKYNSASRLVTFTISKATSQLGSFSITNQNYNQTPFAFTGPNIISGNGSITYSISTGNDVATYDAITNKITMLKAGAATIRATLSETPEYNSTTSDVSFNIYEYPIVGELIIDNRLINISTFTIANPSKPVGHNGSWAYLALSENISVTNGGIVTMLNSGIAEIQATLSSDGFFLQLIITAKFSISPVGEQPSTFNFINSQEVKNSITNQVVSSGGITTINSDDISSGFINQLNPSNGTIQEKSENKSLVIDTLFNIFGGVAITLPKNAIFIPDIFNLDDIQNITLINTSSSTSANPTIIDGVSIGNKSVFLSAAKPNEAIELRGSGENQNKKLKIIKIDQINYSIIKMNGVTQVNETKQKGETILFAGFNVVLSSESIQLISKPGAPTNLITTLQGTDVRLTWNEPIDNGGLDITDYLIEYDQDASNSWVAFNHSVSTVTNIIIPALAYDINYRFRVSAINAEGTSVPSTLSGPVIIYQSSPSQPVTIIRSGGDPIIQPLIGSSFALASHIKFISLLADYSNKVFVNGQVEMLKQSDFPKQIYWDSSFSKTSEITHMYANSYYRKFSITYGTESIEIDADTLKVTMLTPLNKLRVVNFKPKTGIQSISFNKTYPLTSATKGIKIGFANYLFTITSDINTDDRHYLELLNVKQFELSSLCGALISKARIIRISNLEGKELYDFDTNPFL
jgi:hypothetical protein